MSEILKIDFPKKYTVVMNSVYSAHISVPPEFEDSLIEILKAQSWVTSIRRDVIMEERINFTLSRAYEFSEEEARAALERICEHVMSPQTELDLGVLGEVLGDEKAEPSAMDG